MTTPRARAFRLTLLSSLLALGALATAPAHAVVDDLVRNGLRMAEGGQARQAFDMLAAKEIERAGDPDFDLVLGIAGNEAGEFARAIFALERVLLVQPSNARAQAELGRALFAVGDTKGARDLLNRTRQQAIPVEAARTIDQFLQAIDKAEESGTSSAKGYAEAVVGHDSNVNSGPGVGSVAVPAFGGLVLALNPGGVKTSGAFYGVAAGISGRYVIDSRWSFIGNGSFNLRNNDGNSAFDTRQAEVSGGFAYRVERHDLSVVAQFGLYDVNGTRSRDSGGLVGEWTYRFDGFRQVSSYAQWARLTYPGQNLRDVDRYVLGSSYAHLFPSGLLAFGGGYIGQEAERSAGVPHLGHKLWGLRGGVQKPLRQDLAVFATAGYEDRRFGGTDPLFLVTRHDEQANLNVGLSWSPAPKWRVTPQVAWTRASSNIVVNDYDKVVYSITARREF